MLAIALASFKEAVRKKLFLLVGLITLVYLILFFLIAYYYVQDMNKNFHNNNVLIFMIASQIISILGFYFSSMLLALLTIVSSVSSISSEIENGTIHSIITKPIKRWEYVLGKYMGLGFLLTVYSLFLYSSVLSICYFVKLPLLANLGFSPILKGLAFFVLQPLAILSLSIFGSTGLKSLTNGIVVVSIYILGSIGSMMEQIGAMLNNNQSIYYWGILSSLVSPFDVIYRQMTMAVFSSVGLTNPFFGSGNVPGTIPSKWMTVYVFIYIIGLIILAVRKFNTKDIS